MTSIFLLCVLYGTAYSTMTPGHTYVPAPKCEVHRNIEDAATAHYKNGIREEGPPPSNGIIYCMECPTGGKPQGTALYEVTFNPMAVKEIEIPRVRLEVEKPK